MGFFVRPLGAIILSHFGDRMGRKSMLVLTLVSMGVGTTLIGLLPTYETIGVAAPILLVACRSVQGIAVGGEWGGVVLILRIDETPDFKRNVREGKIVRFPVLDTIRRHPKDLLVGLGARITEARDPI